MREKKTKHKLTEYLLKRITDLESYSNALLTENAHLRHSINEAPNKEAAIVEMQEAEVVLDAVRRVCIFISTSTRLSEDERNNLIEEIAVEFNL